MAVTVRLYAERKQWPLDRIEVHASRQPASGKIASIETELVLGGNLNEEQRQRLTEIASRCPVHQTLTESVTITHH